MTATMTFAERYGTDPGLFNGSISNLNFGNLGSPELDQLAYPIARGNNSYEKWVMGSFSGTFTQINNIKFWMSAGSYGTGEVIKFDGSQTTYATPVTTTSAVALGSVPTALPGANNVSIKGLLTAAGSLTATGSTDLIVLQYQTTASVATGPTNQKTFTLRWEEI